MHTLGPVLPFSLTTLFSAEVTECEGECECECEGECEGESDGDRDKSDVDEGCKKESAG